MLKPHAGGEGLRVEVGVSRRAGTVFALRRDGPGLGQHGLHMGGLGATGGQEACPCPKPSVSPPSLPPPAWLQVLSRQRESGLAFVQPPQGRKTNTGDCRGPASLSS